MEKVIDSKIREFYGIIENNQLLRIEKEPKLKIMSNMQGISRRIYCYFQYDSQFRF